MKKAFLAGVVVLAGVLTLWFYARPAYKRHREAKAIEQAKSYFATGDYRNASLSARQALRVNPSDLEACRILADLAERSRSPYVLDWRRRVVETAPTVENKLLLASSALRAQGPPYPLAAEILEELKGAATNLATYHAVSAELALRLKRTAQASEQFEQASRLEPTNELYQLNLAVLRLQVTDAATSPTARATLESLSASTNVGAVALRWLAADSLGRNDLSAAERFSRQLLADPRVVQDDRLQHLTILRQSKNPEFDRYLSALQKSALTNSLEVYGIAAWMVDHSLAGEAFGWLTNCPAQVRTEQPVPLAMVDCYLANRDWIGLETFLEAQKWGDLEFLRFAFLSRAMAEQNQKMAAEARWRSAVREAGERLGPLNALLLMATSWGRQQAREDLLWQIAKRFPSQHWAWRELERSYLTTGNTRGLNKLYSTMASYAPRNFAAQNNLAATSLLLGVNLPRAHELAKELYSEHPDEAIVASTYAFSLHLQGHTKEGLAALAKLKPEALETPSVAIYYGLLLSEVGETKKAAQYLDIAQKSDLLPEEKALVAAALKRTGPPS